MFIYTKLTSCNCGTNSGEIDKGQFRMLSQPKQIYSMSRLPDKLTLFIAFLSFLIPAIGSAKEWERWPEAKIPELGWDKKALDEAREYSASIDTESVMIVFRGKVLSAWGPVARKRNIHSIRKSLLSGLYGIQVERGLINTELTLADLNIDDNEPSLTAVEKSARVIDLLRARSGIYHSALYETKGMKKKRPERHSFKPDENFYYNNWDFNALGTIYEQLTESKIHADFKSLIADPIGMQDFQVSDGKYVTGDASIHPAYPFRMTARDLARVGQLFLNMGKWEDQQIIPESWVEETLTCYSDAGTRGGYGYMWWLERDGGRHLPGISVPQGSYSARGARGHYILVIPSMELVVVHRVNSDERGKRVKSSQFATLVEHIINAHSSGAEPNPDQTAP